MFVTFVLACGVHAPVHSGVSCQGERQDINDFCHSADKMVAEDFPWCPDDCWRLSTSPVTAAMRGRGAVGDRPRTRSHEHRGNRRGGGGVESGKVGKARGGSFHIETVKKKTKMSCHCNSQDALLFSMSILCVCVGRGADKLTHTLSDN